jgi:hypothetical protein
MNLIYFLWSNVNNWRGDRGHQSVKFSSDVIIPLLFPFIVDHSSSVRFDCINIIGSSIISSIVRIGEIEKNNSPDKNMNENYLEVAAQDCSDYSNLPFSIFLLLSVSVSDSSKKVRDLCFHFIFEVCFIFCVFVYSFFFYFLVSSYFKIPN